MAELLVRVVDKVNNTSVYRNVGCMKRGDVVVVVPDGWVWARSERLHPEWRILRIAHYTVSEAQALLAPEATRADRLAHKRTLQRRGFYINLDRAGLPARLVAYLADSSRAAPAFDVTPAVLTLDEVRALKVQRPPVDDPAVL